jgi:phage baseplate assembly protein W
MRPNYGCNLNSLVFAPNDDTTAAIAIHHVRQALLQWEPRIDILDLEAHRDPEQPHVLEIVLKYRVRITHQAEELQISLNLAGGGA